MSLHLGVWVGHGQRSPDRSQTAKARLRPVTRDCSATLQNSCLSDFEHKCWKKAIGPPSTYPPTPNSEPWTLGSPWQSDMHGAMFVVHLGFHTNHKPATHLTSAWIAFIFLYLSGSIGWGLFEMEMFPRLPPLLQMSEWPWQYKPHLVLLTTSTYLYAFELVFVVLW